ncbi:paired amphipathic helix protein Sin3a-like isoform X1 [Rhopilema esculentum]|uniref:paired amphipathic helix protein Sin3a-like isoform X1 n=1 Tax=Rhopilema esculentum TaxID=499914 RepID=UPI0031D809CF
MKRSHPEDQENVYPGSRRAAPQFSHLAPGAPVNRGHHFERVSEVTRPPFSVAHLPSGPGGTQGGQSSAPGMHPHPPQQTVHVQTPFPHGQGAVSSQVAGQQHFQRLKVEDALSYLDQVKLQFGTQPQVYNEFLDIMKEFKSQTIDTPGVISRVSTLFKGHPELIVGFNTFLPPGYKIEVTDGDSNTISFHGPGTNNVQTIIPSVTPTLPSQASKPHAPQNAAAGQSSSFSQHQQQQQQSTPSANSSAPSQPSSQQSVPKQQQQQSQSQQAPSQQQSQSGQGLSSPGASSGSGQSQTQVNKAQHHAINYVTKIKNRFQGQPEVYQKFLDILNNYQTEQKNIKENALDNFGRALSDQEVFSKEGKLANEVYQQVAKLFQNQEDLLQEFSQFLPDASGSTNLSISQAVPMRDNSSSSYMPPSKKISMTSGMVKQKQQTKKITSAPLTPTLKPEPMDTDSKDGSEKMPTKKKHRSALKDVSLAEAVKHGSFSEFAFFNKVRKALKSQEVYENFLRCLALFNQEVVSRLELVQLMTNFLGKFPDLFTWFKTFLGYKENQPMEPMSGFKDRGTGGELAHLELDYATCKRSGASYRALPQSYNQPKCTGRSQLCREVLNDVWVSLPSWSEDTQFPGTRKTQYEEYIYKCEDERFELDIVIETNLAAIKSLEAIHKKLFRYGSLRMSYEDQQRYRLDSSLGGSSEVICKKAIYRIYGDKSAEIIDGLKKTPHVAVPLVLKRLKAKDEEWKEAQKQFNKIWREQNEKYYLKSLDHQGINFKQTDYKAMRSKSLIHEIEQLFEERTDQAEDGNAEVSGPHLTYTYKDKSILDDAASLIIHHMKRQTAIHPDDKTKIKHLLYQFVPDLFFAPRTDLSDDEESSKDQEVKPESFSATGDTDDLYNLFFVNNTWYVFFRLHQMLCERLLTMYELAMKIAEDEARDKMHRREGTAVALRLKQATTTDVEEYFPVFLEMVRNLLDGNMDASNFEDTLREMFGVSAYIAFTMDRLIQNIVRQLQNLITDETSLQVTEMFKGEKLSDATGGPSATVTARAVQEQTYQKKTENILSDENCFKVVFHKDRSICTLNIELLPSEDYQSEDVQDEKWSEYVEKFVGSKEVSVEVQDHLYKKPIYLCRNRRFLKSKAFRREDPKKLEGDDEDKGSSADETISGNTSPKGEQRDVVFHDVINEEGLECRFKVNSYKMTYIAGTANFMYRLKSLPKAVRLHSKIHSRVHQKFKTSHDRWLADNVSREQSKSCDDWLMGKTEGLKPCTTQKKTFQMGGIVLSSYSAKYNTSE